MSLQTKEKVLLGVITLITIFVLVWGCTQEVADCTAYPAGAITLYKCNWSGASSLCRKLGSPIDNALGCMTPSVIVTTDDWYVLAHELCHWSLWVRGNPKYASHDLCPIPYK